MKLLVLFSAFTSLEGRVSSEHFVFLPFEAESIDELKRKVAFSFYPKDGEENEEYRSLIINADPMEFLNEYQMEVFHKLKPMSEGHFNPSLIYTKITGPCSSTSIKHIIPFDDEIAKTTGQLISLSSDEISTFREPKLLKPNVEHFLSYCEDMYGESRVFQLIKSKAITIRFTDKNNISLVSIDNDYLPLGLTSQELGSFDCYNKYYLVNGINSVNNKIINSSKYQFELSKLIASKAI